MSETVSNAGVLIGCNFTFLYFSSIFFIMGGLFECKLMRNVGILLYLCVCLGYKTVDGKVTIPNKTKNYIIRDGLGYKQWRYHCGASCSNKTCSYTWSSTKTNTWTVTPSGQTLVVEVASRNPGTHTFVCTVTDSGDNTKDTCRITLELLYAPEVSVKRNGDVLECTPNGNPTRYVFDGWKQTVNGVTVRNHPGKQIGESMLVLNITPTYEGTGNYECSVSNTISDPTSGKGFQTGDIDFTQQVKPVVLTPIPIAQNVSKGDNFSTIIEILSYVPVSPLRVSKVDTNNSTDVSYVEIDIKDAPVVATFYRNDVEVNGTHIHVKIIAMKEEYFGKYEFVVENSKGSTSIQAQIDPQGAPDIPLIFKATDISHDAVLFHLISGFYNGANQTLEIEYRLNTPGSQWTYGSETEVGSEQNKSVDLRVHGLESATSYVFRAFSYNAYEKSEATRVLLIDTETDPLFIGMIAAAVVGFTVIVIVILVIVCKKKKSGRKKIPKMLPNLNMNDILASDLERTDSSCRYVYENTEMKPHAKTDNDIYENTQTDKSDHTDTIQDENYANVPLVPTATSFHPKQKSSKLSITDDAAIYSNTELMMGVNAHAQGPDPTVDSNGIREKSYANVLVKATPPEDDDDDYLDMEMTAKRQLEVNRTPSAAGSKHNNAKLQPSVHRNPSAAGSKHNNAKLQTGVHRNPSAASSKQSGTFSNTQSSYTNGNDKSWRSKQDSKKKQPNEDEPSETSELYMEMDAGGRESVPEFRAPPPPAAHKHTPEDGYVNLG